MYTCTPLYIVYVLCRLAIYTVSMYIHSISDSLCSHTAGLLKPSAILGRASDKHVMWDNATPTMTSSTPPGHDEVESHTPSVKLPSLDLTTTQHTLPPCDNTAIGIRCTTNLHSGYTYYMCEKMKIVILYMTLCPLAMSREVPMYYALY